MKGNFGLSHGYVFKKTSSYLLEIHINKNKIILSLRLFQNRGKNIGRKEINNLGHKTITVKMDNGCMKIYYTMLNMFHNVGK